LTLARNARKEFFGKSHFKVTCDISPTISGWLLVIIIHSSIGGRVTVHVTPFGDLLHLFHNPTVLSAISKSMWVVKFC